MTLSTLLTSVTTLLSLSSSSYSSASFHSGSSSSNSNSKIQPPLHHPLSQVYADLAQRTNQLETWPDSQAFCEQCLVPRRTTTTANDDKDDPTSSCSSSSTTTTTTLYTLPEFTDGHGPVGLFALLHNNDRARSILTLCEDAFDEFCQTVCKDILMDDSSLTQQQQQTQQRQQQQQRDSMKEHWILQTLPTSHHITVAMIQEHPQFLRGSEDDLKKWRPLSDEFLIELSDKLRNHHQTVLFSSNNKNNASPPPPPLLLELKLDSLLWTPDGAMIAGFVDQPQSTVSFRENCPSSLSSSSSSSSSSSFFQQLRESSLDIVRQEMGGDLMTSRPKKLIHVTIGRILGLPPLPNNNGGATTTKIQSDQSKALTELCRRYNTEYLPMIVDSIQRHHVTGGSFPLTHLSVARNKIWMMQDYIEYATWPLIHR